MTIGDMQLRGVLGFEGGITDGLLLLPDGQTLAYALGSTIVLREKTSVASQRFLHGHTDKAQQSRFTLVVHVAHLSVDILSRSVEIGNVSRVWPSDAHGLPRRRYSMEPRRTETRPSHATSQSTYACTDTISHPSI